MLKTVLRPALAAGIALATVTGAGAFAPAAAQAQKVAVVNLPAVVVNSNAYKTAQTQRQTTYAAQLQQAETRRQALQAQLDPLVTAFNTARAAANPNQTSLQQQAQQIQQIQQQGQNELNQILGPVALSQAYVEEQINDKIGTAVENAAKAKGVTLIVSPDTVVYADASHNLNEAVLAQLNTLIPSAQLVPPTGWLPREMREQQEAAAAQSTAAPVSGR